MKSDIDLDQIAAERDTARRLLPLDPLPVSAEIAQCVRELSTALDRWLAKPQPANGYDLALRVALATYRKCSGIQ